MSRELHRSDLELSAEGVRTETERLIHAARMVAHALSNTGSRVTVAQLAEQTGLSPQRVQDVFASPEFDDLVRDMVRRKTAAVLARGVVAMEDIMVSETVVPADRISAFKALTAAYEKLGKGQNGHDAKAAREDALGLLETLRTRREITIQNGN